MVKSQFDTEKDLQSALAAYLSKWFIVTLEAKCLCGKHRADLLLYHKNAPTYTYPIIIETKVIKDKTGSQLAKWCLQASAYSNCEFGSGGQNPITLIYPSISHYYFRPIEEWEHRREPKELGNNVTTFLYAAFGIGEVKRGELSGNRPYIEFHINNCRIWSSRNPEQLNIDHINRVI